MRLLVTTACLGVVGLLLGVVSSGCDEALPPRDVEGQLLLVQFSMPDTAVSVHAGVVSGQGGELISTAKNLYEDVLDDTGMVRVTYTVVMEELPDTIATFTATEKDLADPGVLRGQYVSLLPGASAIVRKRWSHSTNAGTPFWTCVPLFPASDPGGTLHWMESGSVPLLVTASIRTYKRVPAVVIGPVRILVIYKVF
jgi:hypothetical protein